MRYLLYALPVLALVGVPVRSQTGCSVDTIRGTYAFGYFGQSGPPFTAAVAMPSAAAVPMALAGRMIFDGRGNCEFTGRMSLGGFLVLPPPEVPIQRNTALNCTYTVEPDCMGTISYGVRFPVGDQLISGDVLERFVVWDSGAEVKSVSQKTGIPGTAFWGTMRRISTVPNAPNACGPDLISGVTMFQGTEYYPHLANATNPASAYLAPGASVIRMVCRSDGRCTGVQHVGIAGGSREIAFTAIYNINSDCTVGAGLTVAGDSGPVTMWLEGATTPRGERIFLTNATMAGSVGLYEGRKVQ